ncbi:AraC-like DNA-binding protein [Altererythrobacter atlanticus]|uniref:Helix-turn-helix domain protein n=1 Tax=Croceibacterium atlanticum TaxID=1267766 RepID=A0A0F7KQD9_9SPHN|nr:helix-turn-helix domain-containing protein [Croceibacterium atlanticum]AKH41341.1 Helix-turn-helix domain protein [Croceibacterium atlanticum]MBB5734145.1 AraC-like DNA-binding protein [Croceibacterium atlanticum]
MACEIDVRFFQPPAPLDGCFTSFYRLNLTVGEGEQVEDWLQPEWANLRFFRDARPEATVPGGGKLTDVDFPVTGPSSLPTHFRLGTTRCWGAGLFPLGWARFIEGDAYTMANWLVDGRESPPFARVAPLADIIFDGPEDDEAEYMRMVAYFMALNKPHHDEDRIRAIHAALLSPEVHSVADFARRVDITPRTLDRLCRRYFGFPPKLLLRRQRFMRSLADWMIGGGYWTDALDAQYFDQSQFTREFKAFMTMSPSEYAALDHPILGAFMAQRARIWGSAAQTLDRPDSGRIKKPSPVA